MSKYTPEEIAEVVDDELVQFANSGSMDKALSLIQAVLDASGPQPAEGRAPVGYVDQAYKCEAIISLHEGHTVKPGQDVYAAPADTEQPSKPPKKYYYKVNGCPAKDAHSPDCICWHDYGTGPRAEKYPAEQPITAQESSTVGGLIEKWLAEDAIKAIEVAHPWECRILRRYIEQTAQDREDAERYRHLRDKAGNKIMERLMELVTSESWDAAVDYDRQQGKE